MGKRVNPETSNRRIGLATLMTTGIVAAATSTTLMEPWQTALLVVGLGIAFAAFLGILPTFVVVRVVLSDARAVLPAKRGWRHPRRWTAYPSRTLRGDGLPSVTVYLETPKNTVHTNYHYLEISDLDCEVRTPQGVVRVASPHRSRLGTWEFVLPDAADPAIPAPLVRGRYVATWRSEGNKIKGCRFRVNRHGVLRDRERVLKRWYLVKAHFREDNQ